MFIVYLKITKGQVLFFLKYVDISIKNIQNEQMKFLTSHIKLSP